MFKTKKRGFKMSLENTLLRDYKEHLKAMVLKSKWMLEKELSKSKVEDW